MSSCPSAVRRIHVSDAYQAAADLSDLRDHLLAASSKLVILLDEFVPLGTETCRRWTTINRGLYRLAATHETSREGCLTGELFALLSSRAGSVLITSSILLINSAMCASPRLWIFSMTFSLPGPHTPTLRHNLDI